MSDDPPNDDGSEENAITYSKIIDNETEIVLPDSIDGKDRYLIIEKRTNETISPLIKREISVDGVYEIVDRNFSYPMTAHVGIKFDSRSFPNIPTREYDVKMKKVKVPSNYFAIGGDGLDRRYVYSNPNYPANPTTLDIVFVVDQNMGSATRAFLRRNLNELLGKMIGGYTNVRAAIWQIKNNPAKTTISQQYGGDTINFLTYYETDIFFELEVPDSAGNNQTNVYKKLFDALADNLQNNPIVDPAETSIANFFMRKSQFSVTDEVGVQSEERVLETVWKNTVRKVIYFSGSTPEIMEPSTYQVLLNHSRESCVQFYYFYLDAQSSGTRTLREFSDDSGGGSFNMRHNSDIEFQKFCDDKFYDSNKIYYGDWDGTFKIAWTDNPAWVLYDIITNVDYGLGNYIDYKSVDKWTLYDIARFCDAVDDDGRFRGVPDGKGGLEPRYTCNIFFVNKEEAYKVIQDIAAIFKGISYWNMEGFSFSADKPKKPIMFFANSNVKEGFFTYSETAKNKRYTLVEVVYNDKYDNYKTKVEVVEDADGIRKYGINPFKINAAGCTSRSEAKRIGRYAICSSVFESDTVSFGAGLEAAFLQVGDVFGVSDEVRNVAKTFGRILEVNKLENSLKIDGEFKDGLASGIFVHIPSGNYYLSDLNKITGAGGGFTGTIEDIRAKRQKQARKLNIHTVEDQSYGALITVTGDFLFESAKTEIYQVEGRISVNGTITGQTILTGITYILPDHTILNGNPRWDSVSYESVTGVLSENNIDITISGASGTGQLVGSELGWTGLVSTVSGVVTVNGSYVGVQPAAGFSKLMALNPDGTLAADANIGNSAIAGLELSNFLNDRNDGEVIIITSRGSAFSNQETPASIFANYGATEVYKIGKDAASSPTANYGYCCAFIKGGYRIIERASKNLNDFGTLVFTYRDLAALSKLRPFYTIFQADVGNSSASSFEEWQKNKNYIAGNKVKVTDGAVVTPYICIRDHLSSTLFSTDYIEGAAVPSTKWSKGNNLGYSTVGFPKNFPCLKSDFSKVYLGETLTSSNVASAFSRLGIEVYVGNGTLGQSNIALLAESNGLGYSGLIIGTGYPRGFYDLKINTNPIDLSLVPEGSLYILSGIGVEPKLYKTLGIKEDEANSYSVLGLEYFENKENFIEKDILDTSPSVYIQSPYDVVIRPEKPPVISSTALPANPSNVITGLRVNWQPSPSPINGYKIYVSRPDYSTVQENDAISEWYYIPSGTETLTIPVNENWGQYDVDVYAQGVLPYKLLSVSAASTGVFVLPNPTLQVGGVTVNSCLVTGFKVDTADVNSIDYKLQVTNGLISGAGRGNFTSKYLTFRWKYIDPTGGIIDSTQKMLENPFLDIPPDVSLQVIDQGGQPLGPLIKNYDRFSYIITEEDNKRLVSRETNPANVRPERNLGLRVVVTDNTKVSKTGTFFAYNVKPSYSSIRVVDSFQYSPYYILSGWYGNASKSGIAYWNNTANGILGSGLRNYQTNAILRSEDETREIMFEDVSGAFKHANYIDGGVERKGINISHRGEGEIDFAAYVRASYDLLAAYRAEYGEDDSFMVPWGSAHYYRFGINEPREVPRVLNNPLGLSNLTDITNNLKTGFTNISFTAITEEVSKGEIIFNCYSDTSTKDVIYADVFTGSSINFTPDFDGLTNYYGQAGLSQTRSYYNQIKLSRGLAPRTWYFFKFIPHDDFGSGFASETVSGYLELAETERPRAAMRSMVLNGGRDQNEEFEPNSDNLEKDLSYKITNLGTPVSIQSWINIGVTTVPAEQVEFVYNGAPINGIGSGARVKRVSTRTQITDESLGTILTVTPQTASTMVLPAATNEGSSVTIINVGENNLYVESQNGEVVSVIRPGERSDVIQVEDHWIDPGGNNLFLER